MFKTKEAPPIKKEATRRKVSVPYPEPGTERELLHNRRYVRENLGSFSEKSWYVTAALPLLFTLAGSVAAIHNLSKYSDPISAIGGWAGAEGVVAVFSYLAMLAMFRSEKIPTSYLVGIGFSTVAAVAVNVFVSVSVAAGRFEASAAVAALAPLATAASVSAVFKVIRSCLDDASRLEFFMLHKTEAADLLRTNQLSRTPKDEAAQDETLKIVLSHTPSKKVADLMTRQVEGLVGTLGSAAPALEAPVPVQEEDEEEVEAEVVVPLRVADDSRQAVMHPSQGRRMVLPEEGAPSKEVLTVTLPLEEETFQKPLTPVQAARRALAQVYWTARLLDRNMIDADFRRRFIQEFSKGLDDRTLGLLDRHGEWAKIGEIRSPFLARLKKEFPVETFVSQNPDLAVLVKKTD